MANLYGPRIVTDGLVFNMDFSNPKCYPGTGSYCYDLSGNNFTGTLFNTPTYTTDGNNKFFAFATNDYITIPNSTLLNTNTPSIEAWFKTNSTSQNGFIFEKGQVNTQYSMFQEGAVFTFRHRAVTSYALRDLDTTTATTAGINTTQWFQAIATKSSTGLKKLYINGVLKNSTNDTTYTTISVSNNGMSIGAYGGSTGTKSYYYNGNIAVVKVYNKELSQDEVIQNYNALKGRFGL